MKIQDAIQFLEREIPNKREGLPQDIFFFASRITPMVNVDLLIKDGHGRMLLAWRDDEFAGAGWHIPGGIIRFKERISDRLQKVAMKELSTLVEFKPVPLAVNEVICSHETRGHFISLLYRCTVPVDYVLDNKGRVEGVPGYLKWHETCPKNLVKVHEMYRVFLEGK